MSGPSSTAGSSTSSPQRTFASGIVHDEETQTRSIPQSRRADGTLRKERKVKPGYTPQEDIARFRSKRLMEEDARRAASGSGLGVPGSASWVAAATSPASGSSNSRYSSTLVGLKPRPSAQEGESKVLPVGRVQRTEVREERPVKSDELASTPDLDNPSKPEGVTSPVESASVARTAPPRGLFARAMGGVATQDRPREGRSTPTKDIKPAPSRDVRTDNPARTSEAVRTPRTVQGTKTEEPPIRRTGPRVAPSSASDAQSWRRGPAPAPPLAKSALPRASDRSAAKESEVDPVEQLSAGVESLKVESSSSEK